MLQDRHTSVTPLAGLRTQLADLGSVVVAFSGGADSALLAMVATDVLGPERALAVTAVSPSLAPEEEADCASLAGEWGLRWRAVPTDELADPAYAANTGDRCYHCRSELLRVLGPVAAAEAATVVLGVHVDDLGDDRPGQRAALEAGAVFPFVDAGLGKEDVRSISRALGLRTWDKPAAACLASRLPTGTPVTFRRLDEVARAESALRRLGFTALRVRHHGDVARVELGPEDLEFAEGRRGEVLAAVRGAGYRRVELALLREGARAVGG